MWSEKFPWAMALTLSLALLAGCGRQEPAANLVLTNYAGETISSISVSHDGAVLETSGEGIRDSQMCRFTLPREDGYEYTVTFEDLEGRVCAGQFTDDFSQENAVVYLRADQTAEGWIISRDAG